MPTERPAVARVSHRFAASPERVFDAWLDAEKVKVWWRMAAAAAGRGASEALERVTIDARLGGRFSFLVRRDGRLIDHTGTYQEIDRPRRLVFSWTATDLSDAGTPAQQQARDQSRVIIQIAPLETGCELTLSHEMHPDWRDFVERANNAWGIMLQAIDRVVSEVPAS